MDRYNTPYYEPNFKYEYPFQAEFKESSVKWYKTYFYIKRHLYKPTDFGTKMSSLQAGLTGVLLFSTERTKEDLDKYFLIDETLTNSEIADVLRVEQRWGYTPDSPLIAGGVVGWTRPAMEYLGSVALTTCTGQSEEGTAVKLTVEDSTAFKAGDIVKCYRAALTQNNGTLTTIEYESMYCKDVTVYKVEAGYLIVNGDVSFEMGDGSTEDNFFDSWANATNTSPRYIKKTSSNITARTGDFACITKTTLQIAESTPSTEERFRVMLGDSETDTLTEYTTPTVDGYKAGITAGSLLVATQPTFSKIGGNLWRVDTNYIKYQL